MHRINFDVKHNGKGLTSSDKITAIPELPELPDPEECIVTINAKGLAGLIPKLVPCTGGDARLTGAGHLAIKGLSLDVQVHPMKDKP